MTNREVIIKALQNFTGAYEENVDFISCPYVLYKDCLNEQRGVREYDKFEFSENCSECKKIWLEKEGKSEND